MAKSALDDLYDIMNDGTAGIRNRLSAAISASRVERLSLPGEAEPLAVVFLRSIVASEHAGLMFRHDYRREAAAGLAYWERRAAKMALTYEVPDQAERQASWRRLVNGGIRLYLFEHNRWPRDKAALLTAADELDVTDLPDPDLVLAALLGGGNRHERRARRAKAIDERLSAGSFAGSETERRALLQPLADIVEARLAEFGLGPSMEQQQPHHQTAAQTLAP